MPLKLFTFKRCVGLVFNLELFMILAKKFDEENNAKVLYLMTTFYGKEIKGKGKDSLV